MVSALRYVRGMPQQVAGLRTIRIESEATSQNDPFFNTLDRFCYTSGNLDSLPQLSLVSLILTYLLESNRLGLVWKLLS